MWFGSGERLWALWFPPCSDVLPAKMAIQRVERGCKVNLSRSGWRGVLLHNCARVHNNSKSEYLIIEQKLYIILIYGQGYLRTAECLIFSIVSVMMWNYSNWCTWLGMLIMKWVFLEFISGTWIYYSNDEKVFTFVRESLYIICSSSGGDEIYSSFERKNQYTMLTQKKNIKFLNSLNYI